MTARASARAIDEPRALHVKTLLLCFVQGIIEADRWTQPYKLPPEFEKVVNFVADAIIASFGGDQVVDITPRGYEEWLRATLKDQPEFNAWNVDAEGRQFAGVSRFDPVASSRDFIDLDALFRNARIALSSS